MPGSVLFCSVLPAALVDIISMATVRASKVVSKDACCHGKDARMHYTRGCGEQMVDKGEGAVCSLIQVAFVVIDSFESNIL